MRGTHTRRIGTLALPAGALAMLAACHARDVAAVDPVLEREQRTEIELDIERNLDLIFIIDDSDSMAASQTSLRANFPRFIEILGSIEGGLPNLHIGVISTDVGADTSELGLDPQDGCEGQGHDGRFIVGPQDAGCPGIDGQWLIAKIDADGNTVQNYDGDLADQFACMAALGTEGCLFEAPLDALKRALNHPDNQDFFREDAHLGVVIISDEEDCSVREGNAGLEMFLEQGQGLDGDLGPLASFRCADFGIECDPVDCEYPSDMRCTGEKVNCRPKTDSPYMHPPDHYAQVLADFKGDSSKVIVANIIGDTDPVAVIHSDASGQLRARLDNSCVSDAAEARPGIRLEAFLNAFPKHQTENTSICDGDLSGPIERIADRFIAIIGSPCVNGKLRDTDPDTAGIQPECKVSDVSRPGSDDEEEFLIPSCEDSGPPCWSMQPDEQCENKPTGLSLLIDRGETSPPPRTTVRARCVADG